MNKPAIKPRIVSAETIEAEDEDLAVGQWYWVRDDDERWLGCIVHLGTNYAEVKSVYGLLLAAEDYHAGKAKVGSDHEE